MYSSDYFGVNRTILYDYGAIDISLICDTPLFIDPMLIFNSPKSKYQGLHEGIVRYLHFLSEKSKAAELTDGQIKSWYVFREIKEIGWGMP